ncbi:MAG: hypothetical protein R3D89_03785 [Sphingomonadaceae bacterium]
MNLTRDRIRSIGWAFVLTVCAALTFALMLRVNAEKGNVHATEREIVAVKQEIRFLETEFHARANQQHLDALNEVEFGYSAPTAGQYIEGERQLARLGKPRPKNAPAPIRMATALPTQKEENPLIAMVSPVQQIVSPASQPEPARKAASPAPAAKPVPAKAKQAPATAGDDLIASAIGGSDISDRLSRIDSTGGKGE